MKCNFCLRTLGGAGTGTRRARNDESSDARLGAARLLRRRGALMTTAVVIFLVASAETLTHRRAKSHYELLGIRRGENAAQFATRGLRPGGSSHRKTPIHGTPRYKHAQLGEAFANISFSSAISLPVPREPPCEFARTRARA